MTEEELVINIMTGLQTAIDKFEEEMKLIMEEKRKLLSNFQKEVDQYKIKKITNSLRK